MTPVPWTSKDKPAMATKEGAQVHCNHRKNLLKESHSVGTIRGQHFHLVSKDETNSMDSQSAKVMDDTSRFLSPKLLPLLRLSWFEVIDKADIRWWHHQKKVDQFDQNIPYADFANFFTAITHSAIDSLKKPMLFLEKMQTFEKNTPFDSYLYYKNKSAINSLESKRSLSKSTNCITV